MMTDMTDLSSYQVGLCWLYGRSEFPPPINDAGAPTRSTSLAILIQSDASAY